MCYIRPLFSSVIYASANRFLRPPRVMRPIFVFPLRQPVRTLYKIPPVKIHQKSSLKLSFRSYLTGTNDEIEKRESAQLLLSSIRQFRGDYFNWKSKIISLEVGNSLEEVFKEMDEQTKKLTLSAKRLNPLLGSMVVFQIDSLKKEEWDEIELILDEIDRSFEFVMKVFKELNELEELKKLIKNLKDNKISL